MGLYFPGGLQSTARRLFFSNMKDQHGAGSAWGRISNFGSPTALSGEAHMAAYNQLEDFLWRLPAGYLGDPEHYAGGLAAFLASDDASYFIGGTLILNGEAAH